MQLLSDFLPILLFFIVFKIYGLYAATGVAIVASLLQVSLAWFKTRRIQIMPLITLVIISLLGGATFIFLNEMFIKWKPTAINWVFALIFLGSQFIGHKTIIQRMMEQNLSLSRLIWQRLNISWVIFFSVMGAVNLWVAYNFDTNTWVNFKLFGMVGITILFVVIQACYLSRHMPKESV